jgi:hypothetical protein
LAVPGIARDLIAVVGALLVLAAWISVVGTLIVPRPVGSWLTRFVDKAVNGLFRIATAPVKSYRRRDQILAAEAAVLLLAQLGAWLLVFYLGYALLFWPFVPDITAALITAGPGLWGIGGIGSAEVTGAGPRVIQDLSALSGIITITLQISYLPTLYGAFNRRENEISLLTARAGIPSWGPELLARTRYALGSGLSTIDTLPDLYERWEAWAADLAESHTTYLPLVRFRSPKPRSSWVVSLLAVLDSAALYLSLSPGSAPEVQARLCLRSGLICLGEVARAMGLNAPVADAPDMAAGLELTYEDFLEAVERLREVDFPIERDPAEAWQDFSGWRVNYEKAAYAIALAVSAVRAPWSGPRLHPDPVIYPLRPAPGRPPEKRHKGQFGF